MQERAKATRRSLVEAAAQLFAEQGYAATSVNGISARSGRTSGAVYFHYTGKEGIAVAVVEDRFATWPQLAARYGDDTVPPLERLVAVSYDIAHALTRDPVTRAGARLWTERTVIKAYVPDPFALWTAATTRLLAQARLAGHVNEGIRPARTARTLVPAFFGLCTLTEAIEGTTVLDGRGEPAMGQAALRVTGDTRPPASDGHADGQPSAPSKGQSAPRRETEA
ncbi:ScbR family autoregulator-binding transcription factor [Streptomyces sp. NPDC060275]|uniref:ScbR family autoregulator-binding transcription factor n=1 Tax=Streptomyces sp. NPDC060275 TaxID=3347090 RepID=UPI00268F4A45